MKTPSCSAPKRGHVQGSDEQKKCAIHGTGASANSASLAIVSQPPSSQPPREGSDLPINDELPPRAGYLNVGLRIESGQAGDDDYAYEDCAFGEGVEFSEFDGGYGPKFQNCSFEGSQVNLSRGSELSGCTFEGSVIADGDVIMNDCAVASEVTASGGSQLKKVTAKTIRLEGASEATDCKADDIFADPEEAPEEVESGLLRPQISGGVYEVGALDSTDVYGGGGVGPRTVPTFEKLHLMSTCDVTAVKAGSITLGDNPKVSGIEPLDENSPVVINMIGFDPYGEPDEPMVVIDHDGFIVVGEARVDGPSMSYPEKTTLWADDEDEALSPRVSVVKRSLVLRAEDGSEGKRLDARNDAAWQWLSDSDNVGDDGVSEDNVEIALRLHENPA